MSNDGLLSTDSGKCVVLLILDFPPTFDAVDHSILMSHLKHCVGIKGTALDWFRSYLTDRSFCVKSDNFSSFKAPLPHGVPQGSIIGPLLFSLYLLPPGSVFRKHSLSFHFYADDCQIYLPLAHNDGHSVQPPIDCLNDIKAGLSFTVISGL